MGDEALVLYGHGRYWWCPTEKAYRSLGVGEAGSWKVPKHLSSPSTLPFLCCAGVSERTPLGLLFTRTLFGSPEGCLGPLPAPSFPDALRATMEGMVQWAALQRPGEAGSPCACRRLHPAVGRAELGARR